MWLRNENPRLRTLPLAAGLRVDFFEPCDTAPDRRAVLRRLSANVRLGQYFYSLTSATVGACAGGAPDHPAC